MCHAGYTGQNCENKYIPCDPSPCLNDGECLEVDALSYKCQCPTGEFHITISPPLLMALIDCCDIWDSLNIVWNVGVSIECWCVCWMLVCLLNVGVSVECWCVYWMLVCLLNVGVSNVGVSIECWCVYWMLVCLLNVGVSVECWCVYWMLVCLLNAH